MSEAVTVPSLMMITSIVSEELLARDTHTQRLGSSMSKVAKTLCSYISICAHAEGWRSGSIGRVLDSRFDGLRFEPRQEHKKKL